MRNSIVVVAHDYITQRGGAERVAIELAKAGETEQVLTALYAPNATFPAMAALKIRPSFLNYIKAFRRDPRLALPFLALAWQFRLAHDADVVLCSSSGWSHGVRTRKNAKKIVYCHNPARWLYQTQEYLLDQPWHVRRALKLLKPFLLQWDKRAAQTADVYIANSTSVANRIKVAYGREAQVIFPPVSIDSDLPLEPLENVTLPFFLMVGRSRGYKGAQPLIEAFKSMPDKRLVITGSASVSSSPKNVQVTGLVSDAQLRWLYANATALLSVSKEDFGLTPIEANAFGTPALLLRAGGFLDSTNEGVSGLFIEEITVDSIVKAVSSFPKEWDRCAIKRHASKFSATVFRARIREIIDQLVEEERR